MSVQQKRDYTLLDPSNQVFIPIDYGFVAYMIMFYEGVGNLFPWNAFITASNYYAQRFCGTSFEYDFENFFSLTYTLSQTIGLALSIFYQNKMGLTSKIIWPLLCYSSVFALTTAMVAIQDIEPTLLFWVTLISSCLCGCFGAILSGGLFGLGAMFPPTYTAALMNGQGLAGLIVATSGMLTSLAAAPIDDCDDDSNDDDDGDRCKQTISYSALAYFAIATIILVTCIFAYLALGRLSFTRYYIARALGESFEDQSTTTNPFIDDQYYTDESTPGTRNDSRSTSPPAAAADKQRVPSVGTASESNPMHERDDRVQNAPVDDDGNAEDVVDSGALSLEKVLQVFSLVKVPAFSVFFVFTVTIGIFPSLIVLLESTEKCSSSQRFNNDLFVPFFFLLFNLFDFIGRVSAGLITNIFSPTNVWIPAVLRVIFVPLFLFCRAGNSQVPVLFNNDAFPIIFMMLMALSNGYVASTCMMLGAGAANAKDAPIAGTIMIFSLTSGLFMGACTSFVVVLISQGKV